MTKKSTSNKEFEQRSVQTLAATTVGLGPFNPAIRWNDRMWVLNREYDDEDNAIALAVAILTQVADAINEALTGEDFKLQD